MPVLHPSTWSKDVLSLLICPPKLAAVIVCGAWSLWSGRYARRHGRKLWEPGAAVQHISTMLEELAMLKMPTNPPQPRREKQWQKPSEGGSR